MALGQLFLRVLRFSTVSIVPPVLHAHLHLHVALNHTDKRAKPGNLPKSKEIWERWIEKKFHLVF